MFGGHRNLVQGSGELGGALGGSSGGCGVERNALEQRGSRNAVAWGGKDDEIGLGIVIGSDWMRKRLDQMRKVGRIGLPNRIYIGINS